MTLEDLSPEASTLLKSLRNKPQPVADSAALQELFRARLAMGSIRKTHVTAAGIRVLESI